MDLYPFYDDELLEDFEEDEEMEIDPEIAEDEDGNLLIFSLTFSNTLLQPDFRFNFAEKNGKYVYVGSKSDDIEIDFEVFVEKRDGEYYLTCKKSFNEIEVYKKEVEISYEELLEYAIVEEIEEYDDEENETDIEDIIFEEFIDDFIPNETNEDEEYPYSLGGE